MPQEFAGWAATLMTRATLGCLLLALFVTVSSCAKEPVPAGGVGKAGHVAAVSALPSCPPLLKPIPESITY
jgi:hypothetical protein